MVASVAYIAVLEERPGLDEVALAVAEDPNQISESVSSGCTYSELAAFMDM